MQNEAETRTIEFGPFRISTADRLLHRDGQVIHLYPRPIDVLLVLLASDGRVMTREELMKAVWGDTIVEEGGLTSAISDLRKALGDDPKNPRYIETISKRGYRWVGPITTGVKPTPLPPPPIPVVWVACGLALLAVTALGSLLLKDYFWRPQRSVVVFPLENLSRDPAQNYLSAGMTEALLAALGKIGALKVIAYPGSKSGDSVPGPAQIAHSLKADYALTGSVLHDGDRVRITAHLLEARTGQQIWAEPYDGGVRDVLELQATVSKRIAEEIRVKLTPQDEVRLAGARKVIPAAYREYLQGRYHWNKRTPEDFRKAMEHFQQAIAADPTWAPPYAGLADAYLLLGSTSYDALPPREAMPKAKAAAASALKMDDSNAEAHASMAYARLAYDWDFPAAEKEFRRALELNPGYPTAHHWYAHYLLAMGRMDEAIAEMRNAWERDPLSLAINTGLGWALYQARRYDEAIEQYRKTLEMEGNFVIARCMLGMAYERKGMKAEAIAEFRRALVAAPDNPFALAGLGQAYASSGNRDEALRIVDQLTGLSRNRYVPSAYAGGIFAALGDNGQAFAQAGKAYDERSHYLIYLNVEPSLDGFRADRRFPDLARRVGLIK